MKDLVKTSAVAAYLERIYRCLNRDFFGGELETPVITIMSTPRAYGHVTCSKVWKSKNNNSYELNIDAGTLSRPIEDVISTVMHEMVHIYNLMHGIQDTSRGNTYHNRKFKDKAESVGLIIGHHPTYGYTLTSPSAQLIDYIVLQGWIEIDLNRGDLFRGSAPVPAEPSADTDTDTPPRRPSSTRKYVCPCCGMSVRATRTVAVKCMDCDEQLVIA